MRISAILFLILISLAANAQEKDEVVFWDANYFEDQFYVGVQYNLLLNAKNGIKNTGVPYSFEAGFIKDIPINKRRNIGFGLGVGYSYDILRPNIASTQTNENIDFAIDIENASYKYLTHNLEIPIEFRWRTSTPSKYNFWRIYTGASYITSFSNTVETTISGETNRFRNIDELRKNNYTLYTSIGHGVWNFHVKYYLKSPFKSTSTTTNNQPLNFNQLKVGVMFYIL